MSNAAAEQVQYKNIKIEAPSDPNLIKAQVLRSLQDSFHDNPSCLTHSIIKNLYGNLQPIGNENDFIKGYSKEGYIKNFGQRTEQKLRGFFTTRMECLVNDTPLHFKDSPNTSLTFVYDQGPHPVNYFQNAINGIFISDAVDTAPKLTNRSQRPVLFTTPGKIIEVPGSYIGFNENVVKSVIFSDFRSYGDQVGCKVIIQASLNGKDFRWFDLSQKFEETGNKLIGYTLREHALTNAKFKQSNARNTGFFIGNANAKKLLENKNLKPIVALCVVVAKILGDFSSALASSPRIKSQYTGAKKMYGQGEQIDTPEMIIHASGDRLCSFEALRQDADTIKTSPRNSYGIIPIQYTPGVNANQAINYKARFDTIHTEITKRFDDLLLDVNAFSIYKYKVDGGVVRQQNIENLQNYVSTLSSQITYAKGLVENYIQTIVGTDQEKYETLYRQKLLLMPQAPLISTSTKDGYRKNLNSKFHIYILPNRQRLSIDLRGDVNRIINNRVGAKRKLRRRTLRRLRGGVKPTKERALADFDNLKYSIREKMFNFALSKNVIDYDSNTPDILIEMINRISRVQYQITIEEFIELVKQNRHQVTDQEEIEWAVTQVKGSVLGKRPKNIYVVDYDEEFMEELEQAIKEHYKIETIDFITLIESIEIIDYIPPITDNPMTGVQTTTAPTDLAMKNYESKKENEPYSGYTSNSQVFTPPRASSIVNSDSESSQGGRKRKTYRRIRLF